MTNPTKAASMLRANVPSVPQVVIPNSGELDTPDQKKKRISLDNRIKLLKARLEDMELDPEISNRNLGKPYANMGLDTLVEASHKLLRINRGESTVDDRDNKANQTFHTVDDFMEERVKNDAGGIGRAILNKAGWHGNLDSFKPGAFSKQLEGLIVSNSLSQPVSGINPIEIMDLGRKVTAVGEGGISSMDSVPVDARNVHPSQYGPIDYLRTPESEGVGVDQRFSMSARKGPDNQVYIPLRNRQTGKTVWMSPNDMYGKKILFPKPVEYQTE